MLISKPLLKIYFIFIILIFGFTTLSLSQNTEEKELFKTPKFSLFYTSGSYSSGSAVDILGFFISANSARGNKFWVGYNSFSFSQIAYDQGLFNLGTYLKLDKKNSLQTDIFYLENLSTNSYAHIFSLEYLYAPNFRNNLGVAYSISNYDTFKIKQYNLNYVFVKDYQRWFTTKLYYVTKKGDKKRFALAQLATYAPSDKLQITLGASFGKKFYTLENNNDFIYNYSSPDLLKNSYSAKIYYKASEEFDYTLSYEMDNFVNYTANYLTLGFGYK